MRGNYPVGIGPRMNSTDSASFQDVVASISVRENERSAEIGRGTNPYRHGPSDTYDAYAEADFQLGFSAAQTTLGAIGHLAVVRLAGEGP